MTVQFGPLPSSLTHDRLICIDIFFNSGYDAPEASRRKIVANVFSMGDKGFLSGDLLRVDERGWCYFVRRLGDCYRWRGENISAQQVERQVGEDSGLACPIVAIGQGFSDHFVLTSS